MNFEDIKIRVEEYSLVSKELDSLKGSLGWDLNDEEIISVKIGGTNNLRGGYVTDKLLKSGEHIEGDKGSVKRVNDKINKRLEDLITEVKAIKEDERERLKL